MIATSWATVATRRLPLHCARDSTGADRALVARSLRRRVTAADSAI